MASLAAADAAGAPAPGAAEGKDLAKVSAAAAAAAVPDAAGEIKVSSMGNVDREKFLHVAEKQLDKAEALIQWLTDNGGSFPKLYMKEYADGVRGVHAREGIENDELIMRIPYKCVFTVEMGKATSTGQILVRNNMEHVFDAPKHIYLMMFLLIDGEDPNSFFRPYYDILPENLSGMPIFWDEEEYRYLTGSYLLQQIQMRKDAIARDYREICRVDPTFSRFSLDRFAWARMIVCSRNFGGSIKGTRSSGMVPYADMLNHYRPRETRWGFDENTETFTIHSCCPIGVGDSVYDSYGKKCQHRFLLNYGFAIEDNREEDGKNPNQIHFSFDLLPESKDQARSMKVMIMEKTMQYPDQRRGIRISTVYTDETTQEAFSYARFIQASSEELMFLLRRDGMNEKKDLTRNIIMPFSLDNEEKVLKQLGMMSIVQLRKYETTWNEDKERLAADDGPAPFTNERNSLIYMAGEKEICNHYIKYVACAAFLLPCLPYVRALAPACVCVSPLRDSLVPRSNSTDLSPHFPLARS